jgi:hypothetical protein
VAAEIEAGTYTGRTTLRYALERFDGADCLLVAFPKLRIGLTRPPIGLRRSLGEIDAHKLYLGADEHTFIGPRRQLNGLHAAAGLIEREAESLGVPRERVVCIGTSMGAVCAMMAGFIYGTGRIVVGAAPIHCGTALTKFVGSKSRRKRGAPEFLALAEGSDGSDPAQFLDRLVLDLALRSTSECRVDLLASPTDYATPSVHEFAAAAVANPRLHVRVHEAEYDRHGAVGEVFFPFLQKLLADAPRTLQV